MTGKERGSAELAGERSDRFVQLATQGAARVARSMLIVADRYGAAIPQNEDLTLTLEDAYKELDEAGHLYDDLCNRPFCVNARTMVQRAREVVMQEFTQQAV